MEHVRHEVDRGRAIGVVRRKRQAELEDRICVVTCRREKTSQVADASRRRSAIAPALMNEEDGVPDEKATAGWHDIYAQGAVAGVGERCVFERNRGAREHAAVVHLPARIGLRGISCR